MNAPAGIEDDLEVMAGSALREAIDRWGRFTPYWRRRIFDALSITASMAMRRWRLDPASAVEDALMARIATWQSVLPPALQGIDVAALRAAYLAIDGARRWPEALLGATRMAGFADALRDAIPIAMPSPAPLAMPIQSL